MLLVLLIVLLVLAIGAAPPVGLWSNPYGYHVSGLLTIVLVVLLVLILMGRL